MTDKKKVIEALEETILFIDSRGYGGSAHAIHDALELLKEQEEEIENLKQVAQSMIEGICLLKEQGAIEPKKETDGNPEPCTSWWYVCGDCGRYIDPNDRFCRHCGREVKWE